MQKFLDVIVKVYQLQNIFIKITQSPKLKYLELELALAEDASYCL